MSKFNLRAINKTVVVTPLRVTHESKGFEVKQSMDHARYNYGLVVASSELNVVAKGDKVYYDAAAGSPLIHEGETYQIMDEQHIKIIDDGQE